ncbi:hypothetical protein [Clostridium beijerinckii]|uniref:hypothetical protein n=1 Tax=Clostridium beijerinckii TaxID=1520 RepID=UPI002432FFCC|nr:hypothetical protein [Clostridium beijerinckii]MDG5852478.1 hypothetical protein [Clostridium beijerinckii]
MSRNKKRKLKLNIKVLNEIVVCARSPDQCKNCRENCESMELFYYPFNDKDIKECFKNDERRK